MWAGLGGGSESGPFCMATHKYKGFPEFQLPQPPGSRVFHKYLLKGLKDCSLRLSNPRANLRTTPSPLAPQNQKAGHPGASNLLVNALVLEKSHPRPRSRADGPKEAPC